MSRCDDHRCNSKQTARQLSSQIWTSLLDWEQEQLVQSRGGMLDASISQIAKCT